MTEDKYKSIGNEESSRWEKAHKSVEAELKKTARHYDHDREVARELTSQLVAAGEEDKQLLASDEAVAHGLVDLRKNKSEGLESLLDQPYFARVVTDEEGKEIEFRLGTASFPAQRIIDWRKGPISKLYYDYKEGEEFSELIQGRDREGLIKLRRGYQGEGPKLNTIELPEGSLYCENGDWRLVSKTDGFSRSPGHDGHLPPILSLITPEQYQLITSKANKPMIIQGIAGSGKTTVALHRLAWLLHEDNGDLNPERTVVIMHNRSLKNYVETTLPELNIDGVQIATYTQWIRGLLDNLVGERPRGKLGYHPSLELFKSSSTVLEEMEKFLMAFESSLEKKYIDRLFQFFSYLSEKDLFWPKWEQLKAIFKDQVERRISDGQDETLLAHLIYFDRGEFPTSGDKVLNHLDHIVIDEAQDFGIVEIKAMLNALNFDKTVTIVGDVAQKIVIGRDFGSWEPILKEAGFQAAHPVTLNVSHRTSEEIMEVASHIRSDLSKEKAISSGRHGPAPLLYQVDNPADIHFYVGSWIEEQLKNHPYSLSAVICRRPKEADKLFRKLRANGFSNVRLGYRDQFDFNPGMIITNVAQVKGLEFRNVLVLEPTEQNYSSTGEGMQNLLYVAATRAEFRLDFMASQPVSIYLPKLETSSFEIESSDPLAEQQGLDEF